MNRDESLRAILNRWQLLSLAAGVVGLAACGLTAVYDRQQFFQSYLMAFMFWLGIALACLALSMLSAVVGGYWGYVTRRLFESGSGTVLLMAVLFVPLILGMQDLYEWARMPLSGFWADRVQQVGLAEAYERLYPEAVAGDELLQKKSIYLNIPFALLRAATYFAIWIVLALLVNRWSLQRGADFGERAPWRLRALGSGGLILLGVTFTFASIDWMMSLEPHWFSSIYGMLIAAGAAVAAMSLTIVVLAQLTRRTGLIDVVPAGVFNDLGGLLLAFVMLWAYMSFSQFLIIWSGNLPEETSWYLRRLNGGWQWLALALVVLHFALPFLLLLSPDIKSQPHRLAAVAGWLIAMHALDTFIIVNPAFGYSQLRVHWMDVAALFGVGGLWLTVYASRLKTKPFVLEIESAGKANSHKAAEENAHG